MAIIIMGKKGDKRKIRWFLFMVLTFVVATITGLGSGCTFYLLSGRWSHSSVIFGITVAILMMYSRLVIGLRTPIDKLRELK